MNKNKKIGGILHGECLIFPTSIPKGAKEVDLKGEKTLIVAESEVTHNHHVIDIEPGMQLLEHEGKRYLNSPKSSATVRCVIAERHKPITLPPGTYELGFQQEFDYFKMELSNVRD